MAVGTAFILLAALHRTFSDLMITFAVGLVWLLTPLALVIITLARRYGLKQAIRYLNLGLTGEEADAAFEAASRVPTPEDKQSFLATAKNASMVTLATTAGAEDLCPICLDEEDMGDPLITLRCGHVFHEKCIDSVIDTAYEKMYAPNYLGLPKLPRDEVLNSLRCPLCRSQMTDLEHDIEEGSSGSVTASPGETVGGYESASVTSPTGGLLSRSAGVTDLSGLQEFNMSHSPNAVPTSAFPAVIQL
ncbi:hypothetical protein Pmar_PMAR002764 [Perkinsus marinus ATCC 50983]|uniref:RING-type domain-containing protein n=1 Tax=Perkinsus marinus (strain ATCC 50983 / TXsc) TaxID=423536 RepID=C5L0I4_PERM5|nr:hypothetical protein Pmar_PMAR002764 [Perkinsus marinus ATCC 50983]EER09759.1 hypothetical protein Pmar_PMAR002764 [Perkinsus marinus ATCC 50983]|eukprot:XP_002777964.1 hypothetical protein Pmar_PMAR002764 [Perkinsus marinus ATCC 50983]